ncbi:MAG: hypothetical protein K6E36_04655 [Oscillospiraceae bacterium]|nr:hypothetical protein [Oscillospiraceae bacterium]
MMHVTALIPLLLIDDYDGPPGDGSVPFILFALFLLSVLSYALFLNRKKLRMMDTAEPFSAEVTDFHAVMEDVWQADINLLSTPSGYVYPEIELRGERPFIGQRLQLMRMPDGSLMTAAKYQAEREQLLMLKRNSLVCLIVVSVIIIAIAAILLI